MAAAAFFDLDRTLIRRSSALALAGSFREHGVIGRGQLAKAAAWQLLFAARGAGAETVRKASEDGLMILKGFAVEDLRSLVTSAMEPVLKPLVYREPLDLAASTAYSDSHTDLPFLEAVGRPVVVNPDRDLRRIAAARGWPVLVFTKPVALQSRVSFPPAKPALAALAVGGFMAVGGVMWANARRRRLGA